MGSIIYIQILIIILFSIFTYLILKKKVYSLVSGFNMKSDEEQQQLIKKGYPQAVGRGMLYVAYIISRSNS